MERKAGTLDGIRRRNLAAALAEVHHRGPVSRAAITAATGLNRSTIAALVAELNDLDLVVEGNPIATSRVGRPSPVVSASETPVVLAVNPELDAITVAVVGLGARIVAVERREAVGGVSPRAAAEIVAAAVAGPLAEALEGRRLLGVGAAVPGLVRASDHVVRWAPHLDWRDVPFGVLLAEQLGVPAAIGNDATLGARAEQLFGAGRGIANLVYLNGGASGIGGGVVVQGVTLDGRGGYAGEFGQNKVGADAADRRAPDGVLEDEVSRDRLLAVLGLPANVDEATLEAALLGSADPEVRLEVARQQRVLAIALANAINVLNPERVVLGGFLASLLAVDQAGLTAAVARSTLEASWEGTRIVPAALGSARLLIGAAELAFAPLLADPVALAD